MSNFLYGPDLIFTKLACTKSNLKSPGNIIFVSSNIRVYVSELAVFNDLYVKKTNYFDVNRGRLCLDRTSNTRTCQYIQVLVVILNVSKKFFLAFSRQCRPGVLLLDAAKDGVSLQSVPVRRLSKRCAAIRNTQHILT